MEAIGVLAVAVGVVGFIAIAAISLRSRPVRSASRRERFIPGNWHPDDDGA
jgi:hypothetical protein